KVSIKDSTKVPTKDARKAGVPAKRRLLIAAPWTRYFRPPSPQFVTIRVNSRFSHLTKKPTVPLLYNSETQHMIFQVDFQAGKPVYLQLADQIRYAAASGRLREGEPLPSLRPLAEELRINR